MFYIYLLSSIILIFSNQSILGKKDNLSDFTLSPVKFTDLPQWKNDDHRQALKAFAHSCKRLMKIRADCNFSSNEHFGSLSDWKHVCSYLPDYKTTTKEQARKYFENYFTPMTVITEVKQGLFTGYYVPFLRGSKKKIGKYTVPLRLRPSDLVRINLSEFNKKLKGLYIYGRFSNGKLEPYLDRAAIEDSKLSNEHDKVLVWVDSAVDAFFLEIQGSGIVKFSDGSTMCVGYDGENGHSYYAIGKELIKRGHMTLANASMKAIKSWLNAHPIEGREIMRTNKSYVFFREISKEGIIGSEGVPLTAERSLAIDRSLIPYGLPIFVDITISGNKNSQNRSLLRRLMIAQDSGGSIRGPIRGDFFWGAGTKAENMASAMRSSGRWWFLIPKSVERSTK